MTRRVYDSEDPTLPDLPSRDQLSWSDYDYLGDSSPSSGDESDASVHNNSDSYHRSGIHDLFAGELFQGNDEAVADQPGVVQPSTTEDNTGVVQPTTQHGVAAGDSPEKILPDSTMSSPGGSLRGIGSRMSFGRRPRMGAPVGSTGSLPGGPSGGSSSPKPPRLKHLAGSFFRQSPLFTNRLFPPTGHRPWHRARQYTGTRSKKERAAWEPGVDVHTTNVILDTPGSTITITDYSSERYRVERYEVYSEMAKERTRLQGDHVEFYRGSGRKGTKDEKGSDVNGGNETRGGDNTGEDMRRSRDDSSFSSSSSMSSNLSISSDGSFQTPQEYLAEVEKSKQELREGLKETPEWGKVRWININGLSWEAISIIGDYYNLHRLAIEDMVDIPQRTKVDMYPHQIFAVLPLLKLVDVRRRRRPITRGLFDWAGSHSSNGDGGNLMRVTTHTATSDGVSPHPPRLEITKSKRDGSAPAATPMASASSGGHFHLRYRRNSFRHHHNHRQPHQHFRTLNEAIMDDHNARKLTDSALIPVDSGSDSYRKMMDMELKRPLYRRNLAVGDEQMSIFLTDDGTVISFLEHSANDIEKAILPRLTSEYTLLRTSCDPSILFESIIDADVDLVYPVVTAYNKIMNEYEADILNSPGMQRTDEMHLMVNELTMLRSTIQPVSSVVSQLKNQKVFQRFISENATMYLSDINDHLISYMQNIDSMTQTIENLLNLVFNTLSVETNNSMQKLSVITVIFLPLSYWTGYYGMNFESFGDLHRNVSFYWEITIPFCIGLMIIIMRKEIVRWISDRIASIGRRMDREHEE